MRTPSRSSPILCSTLICALSQFDQSEQQVFSPQIFVVEPLGFLARQRQDLFATWSKIAHPCISDVRLRSACLTWVKVDTTPALHIYHQR